MIPPYPHRKSHRMSRHGRPNEGTNDLSPGLTLTSSHSTPFSLLLVMGLIATTVVDNRRVINMSAGSYLTLDASNMISLMGSTVFVVYQRDMKPHKNVEIMGQVLKTNLSWVLTSSFSDNETIYNIVYGDYTLKVGSVNDANYKKIAIIGLQIDMRIIFLHHSNVMSGEIIFPYLRTSDGAEGLSIRGNRFLYEVRIYPNSVTKEDMTAIWEEIYHTYHT
jgi:hypothetical protein